MLSAGVYAHGVEVLHRADGYDIAGMVAHDLELYLFPARDAFSMSTCVIGDRYSPPAAISRSSFSSLAMPPPAPPSVKAGRTMTGIAYRFGEAHRAVHVVDDERGYARLAYGLHGVLEQLSVLRLVDGFGVHAEEADVMLFQETALVQLHGQRQTGLTAPGWAVCRPVFPAGLSFRVRAG